MELRGEAKKRGNSLTMHKGGFASEDGNLSPASISLEALFNIMQTYSNVILGYENGIRQIASWLLLLLQLREFE